MGGGDRNSERLQAVNASSVFRLRAQRLHPLAMGSMEPISNAWPLSVSEDGPQKVSTGVPRTADSDSPSAR